MPSPLISDRIPFLLVERCRITVSGNSVIMTKDDRNINLPIRSIQLLILGNGVSITSEAMSICSKERCHIAQSKGGVSIHTVFHSGLYPNPARLSRQAILASNEDSKIRIAKYIVSAKLRSLKIETKEEINRINTSYDLPQILGIEGFITKKEYRNNFGPDFSRDFSNQDLVNRNINVLNSVFYSFITSVICSMGYSPSIGFVHGHTRRGGLAFDIADMFKHRLYLSNAKLLSSEKNMARQLTEILQSNKKQAVKDIIKEIENVCGGLV